MQVEPTPSARSSRPTLRQRAARPWAAGLLIAAASAAFGLAELRHYGVTADSPSLFYAGDRTLFFLTHPSVSGALDFNARGEPPGFHSAFQRFPDHHDPVHYPVLPGLIAASVAEVLHVRLGLLGAVDGHHAGLVLLNALGLLVFCLYASRLLGPAAGIAATVALALFPCAVGHAPNNAKDWPASLWYGIAVLAAGVGVVEGRARTLLAAGAYVGLSLSAKLNAAFVVPTLLLWTPIAWLALYRRQRAIPPALVVAWLSAPFVAFAVFWACWPWLYYGSGLAHFEEYVRFMANYGASERQSWTAYPFKAVAFMTPPLILAAGLLAAAGGWRGGRRSLAVWALLLLWFAFPLVRIALPRSNFYDANRHFLEYVPALCALAGLGVAAAARLLLRPWRRVESPRLRRAGTAGSVAAVGLAALSALVWPIVAYHPYEVAYFNAFIGGLGGAQRAGLFAMPPPSDIRVNGTEGDYWFSSARDASRDVTGLLPRGAPLAICGPGRQHLGFNWLAGAPPAFVETQDRDFERAPVLYVSPRESLCWWRQVRRFESERPVLRRVERGGGLIYELLGPKDGILRPPVSPETRYEREVHPWDREGLRWMRERGDVARKTGS